MEFDGFVLAFKNEHFLFTSALRGIFLTAVVGGESSPASLTTLESEAYRIGKTYYSGAIREIERYAQEMTVGGSEQLTESVEARKHAALDSVRLSVVASIKEIANAARGQALGKSMPVAQLVKVGNYTRSPNGRVWEASKFIHAVVRDFAYQAATDRDISKAIASGKSQVTIQYETEADRKYENATLSLSELAEARQEIFHINASARISDV